MVATVDIVGNLVAGFDPETTINNAVDNLDGTYTITVCNTLNIRDKSTFKVNGLSYVANLVNTSTKEITYESAIAPEVLQIVKGSIPFYFHGTPIATGNEIARILNGGGKLPMAYLMEIITDDFDDDEESAIDRTSSIVLFFMDEANYEDWDTDQHYSGAIIPMMNYADLFVKYLKTVSGVGIFANHSLTYHAKFGLNIKVNSGHVQNLLPEKMSGVQLRIDLPILKSLVCDC